MKRLILATCLLAAALAGIGVSARPASAAGLCVGSSRGPHCYATIQAALDAAADGDTIRIAPGTYAGGIVVLKSVSLVGSGAQATRISGGGPVVTVGSTTSAPTVSIDGVTIADGF